MSERDERIDARLREYAERWRDAQPDPPAADTSSWTDFSRRPSRWWLVPAAAAAVAAVIVSVTVSGGGTSPRTASPAASPSISRSTGVPGVVPWKRLPATHPDIRQSLVPASPDPAVAAQAPPCKAGQMRAKRSMQGATQHLFLTVRLSLVRGPACRLSGYPEVRLLENGRTAGIPTTHARGTLTYPHPVLVAPGKPAMLQMTWFDNWCGPKLRNDRIDIPINDSGNVSVKGFGQSPICHAPHNPDPVRVSTFQPVEFTRAKPESPFADVRVRINGLPRVANAGHQLHFTVTLTAQKHSVSLATCPDYTIEQDASGTQSTHRWSLNCAGVRHRDSTGRPALPAGVPVAFTMQADALAVTSEQTVKFLWRLDIPEKYAIAGQPLTVLPTSSPSADATCEPTQVSLVVAGRTVPLPTFPQDDQPLRLRMHVGDILEFDATGNCAFLVFTGEVETGAGSPHLFQRTASGTGYVPGGPGSRFQAMKAGATEFDISMPMCASPDGSQPGCLGGLATLRRLDVRVLP